MIVIQTTRHKRKSDKNYTQKLYNKFFSSSDSSLPFLIGAGGDLVCESVRKADMLSAHFDGKQSRDPVDLPSTCHPFPSLYL